MEHASGWLFGRVRRVCGADELASEIAGSAYVVLCARRLISSG